MLDLVLALSAGASIVARQTLVVESAVRVFTPVVSAVGAQPKKGDLGSTWSTHVLTLGRAEVPFSLAPPDDLRASSTS